MSFPELFILRHGETEWNAEDRMQGWLNSPLTPKGEMHAARQGELLNGQDLTNFDFCCSPQGRAIQTAGIALARHAPMIRTDDRLREIGVGAWSGRVRTTLWGSEEAKPEGPDGALELYERAPGGEGFDGLEARCRAFLEELTTPTVIVTHGITSRMLRVIWLGMARAELENLPGGQGNIFHMKNGVQSELI